MLTSAYLFRTCQFINDGITAKNQKQFLKNAEVEELKALPSSLTCDRHELTQWKQIEIIILG